MGPSRDRVRLRRPAPLQASVRPPGSKSLSNRALLLAALASGRSTLRGMLEAEDTQVMRACLRRLGASVDSHDDTWEVQGLGPAFGHTSSGEQPLWVGTAGTAARFLTAALASVHGVTHSGFRVDGTPRMRERPMAQLLDALRAVGADISSTEGAGKLPIWIRPTARALRGGRVELPRPSSSQFVSALLVAAARAGEPTRLFLKQGTPARPYVDMTLSTLAAFGGDGQWIDADTLLVQPRPLVACDLVIEPDASAASYFLALAAIHGGTATIHGLGTNSVQGDAAFCRVLERMGAHVVQSEAETRVTRRDLHGIDVDLSDMPDMTLTAAVVALFARGSTQIRGVEILRHHESDRLAAAATELRKLGAAVDELPDGLRIHPPIEGARVGVEVDTYADHRMAMAFAMVGDIEVRDPACVAKTFPRYFDELARLGMLAGG